MLRVVFVGAALAGAVMLSGCKPFGDEAEARTTGAPSSAEQIRDAMAQRNFGTAAELASRAVATDGRNPDLRLLQAKAAAQLGNAGDAARAFDKAVELGLPNPGAAARDSAFDPVRQDPAFQAELTRLEPHAPPAALAPAARSAGVEIGADGSVRAGDVRLDADR